MFSHATVGSNDLGRAERFYNAVLVPLGFKQRIVTPDGGPSALCWGAANSEIPRFYVYAPFNRRPATSGNGSMVAFLATSAEAVTMAWQAGLANGGTDEGPPGERSHYGQGYFGAYLRDPDDNKIHIVQRGDISPEEQTKIVRAITS